MNDNGRMKLQRDEFDAASRLAARLAEHNATPVVDDDYPAVRHAYEAALGGLIDAMKANARFGPSNRYGLFASSADAAPSRYFLITPGLMQVLDEVARATHKFPTWPTDPLHAVAVLGEEFGELEKAILEVVYEPHKSTHSDVAAEAIQTAAMALRFVDSLGRYIYTKSAQHAQTGTDDGTRQGIARPGCDA